MKWKKEVVRERRGREERQVCENIFIACVCPLTSAYPYKCGLEVRAHPASSAALTLRFPTGAVGNIQCGDNDLP